MPKTLAGEEYKGKVKCYLRVENFRELLSKSIRHLLPASQSPPKIKVPSIFTT